MVVFNFESSVSIGPIQRFNYYLIVNNMGIENKFQHRKKTLCDK